MRRRGHHRLWLLLAGAVLLSVPAAGQSYVLTGGPEALWLIRIDERAQTFDAAARPLGGRWRPAAQEIVGLPAATMVIDQRLGVLFKDGQYRIYPLDPELGSTPGPNLPGKPLAAFAGADGPTPYALVLAVVEASGTAPSNANGPTAPPAQAPAPAPAGGTTTPDGQTPGAPDGQAPGAAVPAPPAQDQAAPAPPPDAQPPSSTGPQELPSITTMPARQAMAIFRTEDGQWRRLAMLPPLEGADAATYFVAAAGEDVFVLAAGSAGGNQLLRYSQGQWQPVWLGLGLESQATLAMVVIDRGLVLVQAQSRQDRLAVEVLALGEWASPVSRQLITRSGQVLDWPAGRPPRAARLGDQLALLWEQDGQLVLATASATTGDLTSEPQVQADVWRSQLEAVSKLIDYFLLAVLVAAFVPLLMLRRQRPAKPLELPDHVRPARLLRRLVATVLDFLPLAMLGQLVFSPPAPQAGLSWDRMVDEYLAVADERTAYTIIFTFTTWMIYGSLAEYLRGATLGKWILGLRVVTSDAAPLTLRQALLRNLMKVFELLSLLGIVLTALVSVFTRYRQRLGDLLSRTAVVEALSLAKPPDQPPVMPPEDGDGRSVN